MSPTVIANPRRLVDVAKLHFVAMPMLVAWPLATTAMAFLVNLGVFLAVGETENDNNVTGGLATLFVFALVFYVQAMDRTLALAVGLGVTRREYLTATGLVAVVQAVGIGALLFVLELIERATDGWGLRLRMFDLPRYLTDNPVLQLLSYISLLLLVAAAGMLIGTVYQRWGSPGIFTLAVGTFIVADIAAVLVTWLHRWSDVGNGITDLPRTVSLVLLPLALAALLSAAAWTVIRRSAVH